MLHGLVTAMRDMAAYRNLAADLPARGLARAVGGLEGSSGAVLTAALAGDFPHRVVVVVTPTPVAAEGWLADLNVLVGRGARLYPQREALGEDEPHLEIAGEQVETIEAVLAGRARLVVTTTRATAERTRMPRAVVARRFALRAGAEHRPPIVAARLEAMGYERRPSVVDVAQFAVRGGIIDVYGFGMAGATRLEWWGDELISLRVFDLDTQRSLREIDEVTILPVSASPKTSTTSTTVSSDAANHQAVCEDAHAGEPSQALLELLPADALIVTAAGVETADVERLWNEAAHHLDVARRRGEDVPGRDDLLVAPSSWAGMLSAFARLELGREPADVRLPIHAPLPI